jgi:predicted GNAT family acetyltransferase
VRIYLVYTPDELRGHGYATACTAEITRRLLAEGKRYCFLYTDLSNPTSNKIYCRIGYRPVCDVACYRFT